MIKTDLAIIGAGLAGLSAAYHTDRQYLILEQESVPGGMCRSITSAGSTYDFTGHLLHLRQPEMKQLINKLLPDAFNEIERKAAIFMQDRFLPYPFQTNFGSLRKESVEACLSGFHKAWQEDRRVGPQDSFKDWALATFGAGICEHFIFPYNKKLYCTAPEKMSADWVSWSIPRPDIKTVMDGINGNEQGKIGYNATFLYPKSGGIELLPNALAVAVEPIQYNEEILEIDPVAKILKTASGLEVSYNKLINSMPLNKLLSRIAIQDRQQLDSWGAGLRAANVFNLNFTLDRPAPWPWHWLYLPESKFRCYRIGVSSNISPAVAPPGTCTVYTEVSYLPGQQLDFEVVRTEIIEDLKRIDLISDGVSIIDETPVQLENAYVIHDHFRRENLPLILGWLKSQDIISTGRWGGWEYGGMEDALSGAAAIS